MDIPRVIWLTHVFLQSQGDADHALDSQIDTVLHGTVAKINDIIDSVLQAGVQRVDDALYELDSSMQAGNQNASPPYVLSQIEKASASATEFSTAFNNFIADGPNSPHAEIIRTVSVFSGSIADTLSNTKGLSRFANDDKSSDQLFGAARKSAQATVRFFRGLQSFRLEGMEPLQKTDVVINNNLEVQRDLQSLSKLVESFAPKSTKISTNGDLGDLVDQELLKAADAIDAAAQRLAKLKSKPRDGYSTYELKINDSILAAAIAVTNAIAELIKAATESQQEIVREGRGSSSRTAFYKKNNRWTEGLISAAKAVAASTNTLIETADGVISGRNSPEQLIVASNDVAASTAQLVAASRVKATFMSKTQDRLETASKAVGAACRALVRQVQDIIKEQNREDTEAEDYTKLSSHEFKVREMEQQVRFFFFFFSPFLSISLRLLITFLLSRSRSSNSRTTLPVPVHASVRCARSPTRKTRHVLFLFPQLSPPTVYFQTHQRQDSAATSDTVSSPTTQLTISTLPIRKYVLSEMKIPYPLSQPPESDSRKVNPSFPAPSTTQLSNPAPYTHPTANPQPLIPILIQQRNPPTQMHPHAWQPHVPRGTGKTRKPKKN